MANADSHFVTACMQSAERAGRRYFAAHPDRDTLVADSVSLASEAAQTAPVRATPATIARYAVRQAAVGRQFRQLLRSVDNPAIGTRPKPPRADLDVDLVARTGDDPAEIAAFRIDFDEFIAGLTPRERAIAAALAIGERAKDVARRFGLSQGRITQIRQQLAARYAEAIGE